MVKMEDAVIARFEREGHKFEILVDPHLAFELKQGGKVNTEGLLAADEIFKDVGQGERQSEKVIEEVFGTKEVADIAPRIIREGEVQLTTELRREMTEKRRREIIDYISTNAFDPKTNAPHPPARIENALSELRISVDLHRSVAEQATAIVKELLTLMPIKMEKIKFAIKVPAEYAGKAGAVVHRYDVKNEQWQPDGSLVAIFEIAVGLKSSLLSELNHLTHGNMESKIMEE
jgi:ribosome maturation protein SDO1